MAAFRPAGLVDGWVGLLLKQGLRRCGAGGAGTSGEYLEGGRRFDAQPSLTATGVVRSA